MIYSPRYSNNHTLSSVKVKPYAPQITPCANLIHVSITGFSDIRPI